MAVDRTSRGSWPSGPRPGESGISEPDKLTAAKDPVQAELVKKYGYEMPNLGVSRDDARKIIAFLKGGTAPVAPAVAKKATPATDQAAAKSAATDATQAPAGEAAPAPDQLVAKPTEIAVTPELVAMGKALFTGARQFSKGGAPCAACHAFNSAGVAGGRLAADLTELYEGIGEPGMKGVLKALKFPIMNKAYADKPLTDEEITALVAFAKDAAARKGATAGSAFPAAGAGLFVCLIIGLSLYKRRIR